MSHWHKKYRRPIGVLIDVGESRQVAGQLKLKNGDLFDSSVEVPGLVRLGVPNVSVGELRKRFSAIGRDLTQGSEGAGSTRLA